MELRNMGKTIILSSHVLSDIAEICDRIGVLSNGVISKEGDLESFVAQTGPNQAVRIAVDEGREALTKALVSLNSDLKVEEHRHYDVVQLPSEMTVAELSKGIAGAGLTLTMLAPMELSLESAFISLTEGGVE